MCTLTLFLSHILHNKVPNAHRMALAETFPQAQTTEDAENTGTFIKGPLIKEKVVEKYRDITNS